MNIKTLDFSSLKEEAQEQKEEMAFISNEIKDLDEYINKGLDICKIINQ